MRLERPRGLKARGAAHGGDDLVAVDPSGDDPPAPRDVERQLASGSGAAEPLDGADATRRIDERALDGAAAVPGDEGVAAVRRHRHLPHPAPIRDPERTAEPPVVPLELCQRDQAAIGERRHGDSRRGAVHRGRQVVRLQAEDLA